MSYERAEHERVQACIRNENVEFVNLQFSDIVGVVKQVTIPVAQWPNAAERGVWFDGSSIEGFARIAESDMFLVPDPGTFAVIPWDQDGLVTARVICDVCMPNGDPFEGDPRFVLKRALAEARQMGYVLNTGPEFEFYLFRCPEPGRPTTEPHDQAGYFDVSTDQAHNVRGRMGKALKAFGIEVEASHHEVAVGQHEIDFRYGEALQSADHAVTLRVVVKAIAQLSGLYASFMPKPIEGISGSGMHTHQSLTPVDGDGNAFYDPSDRFGLSEIARQYIAGQLRHAPGMTAVLAPLVNSYKRLVPGYEAPVYVSWARVNRSALIRVPQVNGDAEHATRVELRCPDPSCNPYLAFAVMLRSGLDGIRNGLVPPDPAEEDLFNLDRRDRDAWETLPGSLGEALVELEDDDVVKEALGDHVLQRFLAAKRREWDEYRRSVSKWELERYLSIY